MLVKHVNIAIIFQVDVRNNRITSLYSKPKDIITFLLLCSSEWIVVLFFYYGIVHTLKLKVGVRTKHDNRAAARVIKHKL